MQTHQLPQAFLALSPAHTVSLTTIRAPTRNDALDLLDGYTYFFAYELLDTRALHSQYATPTTSFYFEIVSADQMTLPVPFFVDKCTLTIGELYQRLSESSFRVEKETIFRRLSVDRSESLKGALNPLCRLLYRQDVSCLSNLDA